MSEAREDGPVCLPEASGTVGTGAETDPAELAASRAELAEMRARLENLADLYRTSRGDLDRVTAERDAALASLADVSRLANDLMDELAEATGED